MRLPTIFSFCAALPKGARTLPAKFNAYGTKFPAAPPITPVAPDSSRLSALPSVVNAPVMPPINAPPFKVAAPGISIVGAVAAILPITCPIEPVVESLIAESARLSGSMPVKFGFPNKSPTPRAASFIPLPIPTKRLGSSSFGCSGSFACCDMTKFITSLSLAPSGVVTSYFLPSGDVITYLGIIPPP